MAINIPIISSLDPKGFEAAKKEFASLTTKTEKAKFAFGKMAVPAAAALTAVAGLGFKAAQAASDLNEEISKSAQIFGPATASVNKFASTAAKKLGQSKQEALAAAANFGIMGQAAGLSGEELAGFSTDLVELSSDLASFNNAKPEDVVNALGAALRGEAEPMRKFGVLLNDATLKAKAMEMGIYSGNGTLDQQAKILAANAIVFEQTGVAQGDFARTSDGAANKQRILEASIKDATTQIGNFFLPILDAALSLLAKFADFASRNTKLIAGLAFVVGGLAIGILAVNGAIKAYSAATKAAAALQAAWNFAMAANPIGVIVLGIAALVTGVVLAYRRFDGFRIVVNKVVNAVIGYFEFMINAWIKAINVFVSGINKFTGIFRKVGIPIAELGEIGEVSFGRLSTAAKAAGDDTAKTGDDLGAVKGQGLDAASGLSAATGAMGAMGDKAKEAAGKLKDIKKAITEDMSEALKTAKEKLKDATQDFQDYAKSVGDSVKGAFNFGAAQGGASDNAKALTEALQAQAKAQSEVTKAKLGDDAEKLKEAQYELAKATEAVIQAQSKPMTFFDELNAQADKTKTFGELVNRLLAAGLSQEALQEVINAGVDSGTAIANELLSSADGVLKANNLVAEMNSVAQNVGLNSATSFKQAGVDAATNLVAGIEQTVKKYKLKLSSKGLTAKQARRLAKQFAVDVDFNFMAGGGSIPALAEGGITTGPTMALIGDNPGGREAVIPLDKFGGLSNNYTISVNAGVGNPVEIGREIVTAIRKYEKANGTGWRA
jgi:hypothetical protein